MITRAFKNAKAYELFFAGCSPNEIAPSAFERCNLLRNVSICEGAQRIRSRAFADCRELEQIDLPPTLLRICESAFEASGLGSVVIPQNVEYIGTNAFANCCRLRSVIIPPAVRAIANSAFSNSSSVQIAAISGTYAHRFAIAHGIPFVPIETAALFLE